MSELEKLLVLAQDSMAKASSHEPLGPGELWKKKDPSFQLPAYVQHIAHALESSGHSKSQAIAIAVGTVKRWASGGGHVDSNTRAAAAKASSEWEKLKERAHAKLSEASPLEALFLTDESVAMSPPQYLEELLRLDNTEALEEENGGFSSSPEDDDNDAMHQTGVSMNAVGMANFGSVVLGHVLKAPQAAGYRGVHQASGLKTKLSPTRAKAALALLALHHALKHRKAG